MERFTMKKIAILTSSRADYGIYYPLLCALQEHPGFTPEIIAFGSHLSPYHGFTIKEIEANGFEVKHIINSLLLNDDENSVATATALTALKFSEFWKDHSDVYDLVFCLGDRYEMFGAVTAGIPFGILFAHIHSGETTLGAIDNIYRHAITLSSEMFFTSTKKYSDRVKELVGSDDGIVLCGALALDNLEIIDLYTISQFKEIWNINLGIPTVLMTIHPETVSSEKNRMHAQVLGQFLEYAVSRAQIVITMPNADTLGSVYRLLFKKIEDNFPSKIKLIENFGTRSYFSCLQHSKMVVGNSSSGIIEAASFGKYVLNIGDRQKGRTAGENVMNSPYDADKLQKAFDLLWQSENFKGTNPYYHGGAVKKIIRKLENYFNLS